MFPELTLGAMLGNLKVGSVVRNATALIPLWRQLDPRLWRLAIPLCLGSTAGALSVTGVSQTLIPIVLTIGLLVNEVTSHLRLGNRSFYICAFIVGIYGGILGAGIMLLILTLVHLRSTELSRARANAICLELILSLVAVLVFWKFALIIPDIAIVWTLGSLMGGYIGGHIVHRTGKLPALWQKNLVRLAFVVALTVSLWRVL